VFVEDTEYWVEKKKPYNGDYRDVWRLIPADNGSCVGTLDLSEYSSDLSEYSNDEASGVYCEKTSDNRTSCQSLSYE
jgi:hypothetical protein